MTRLDASAIPFDFPVVPVTPTHPGRVYAVATCGECGLSWDDTISTEYTPAPGGRCPFETFHEMDEPDEPDTSWDLVLIDANRIRDIWNDDEMTSVTRNRMISQYIRWEVLGDRDQT